MLIISEDPPALSENPKTNPLTGDEAKQEISLCQIPLLFTCQIEVQVESTSCWWILTSDNQIIGIA